MPSLRSLISSACQARRGQRFSGAARGVLKERQNRRRLVARRGLRWGLLGPPSVSVGPSPACRLPPSVLSCSQAQLQLPLDHDCTAPGTPLHFHKKGLGLALPSLFQTAVKSERSQLLPAQAGHTGVLLTSV